MQHQHKLWLKLYLTWKEYSFTILFFISSFCCDIAVYRDYIHSDSEVNCREILDEISILISVFSCLHAILSFACIFKQVIVISVHEEMGWESEGLWVVFTCMWLIWTHFFCRRARMTSTQRAWGPLRTQTPHGTLIWWVMKIHTSYKEKRRDEERSRESQRKVRGQRQSAITTWIIKRPWIKMFQES